MVSKPIGKGFTSVVSQKAAFVTPLLNYYFVFKLGFFCHIQYVKSLWGNHFSAIDKQFFQCNGLTALLQVAIIQQTCMKTVKM